MTPLYRLLLAFALLLGVTSARPQAIVNPSPLVLNPTGTTTVSQGHLAELLQRNPVPSVLTQILNGKPTAGVSAPSPGSVAGRAVPLLISGRVTGPALASLLGGALKRVALPVAAGLAIRQAYCELHPEEGWLCDPMQEKETTQEDCWKADGSSACYATKELALDASANYWKGGFKEERYGCYGTSYGNFSRVGNVLYGDVYTHYYCTPPSTTTKFNQQLHYLGASLSGSQQTQVCPVINGERPAPDKRGKCPTGEMEDATVIDVESRIVPELETNIGDHVKKLFDGGHDLGPALTQESVSGPAKTQGETTTSTTTRPDGTTQTSTQTTEYRHQYNNGPGGALSITTTTVNVTNNNGTVTEEETTGGEPPEQVTEPPLPDMPPVPNLYTRKYPDGMVGVWNDKSDELKQTPIFSFLSSLVPTLGDGGCPAWSLPVMAGKGQTWVADISLPCWLWGALRAIVVVCALLLCRRLIFGG